MEPNLRIKSSKCQESHSALSVSSWNIKFESDSFISDLEYLNPVKVTQVVYNDTNFDESVSYLDLSAKSHINSFSSTVAKNIPVQSSCFPVLQKDNVPEVIIKSPDTSSQISEMKKNEDAYVKPAKISDVSQSKNRLKGEATIKKTKINSRPKLCVVEKGAYDSRNVNGTLRKLTTKSRNKVLRKLYADNPWPDSQDNCIRKALGHTSAKMARIMSELREKRRLGLQIDPGKFRDKERYEYIKSFVKFKVDEWVSNTSSDLNQTIGTTNSTNSTFSGLNENRNSIDPAAQNITKDLKMELVYVKPDSELKGVNMNSVLRYVHHHVPDFDDSWCKYIATKLGQNFLSAEKLRCNMIKDPVLAAARFWPTRMSPDELRFAEEVVAKVKTEKVSAYAFSCLNGVDDPKHDFGQLRVVLSESEQRNVLMLVLRKALPFGPFWDKKISRYIGTEHKLVGIYRRKADQGKLDFTSYLVDVTEKEEHISTHMAEIIKSWRDHNGQLYQSKYNPNLEELKSAMREHLKLHRNTSNVQVLEWAKFFRVSVLICYRTLKNVKSCLNNARRSAKKNQVAKQK